MGKRWDERKAFIYNMDELKLLKLVIKHENKLRNGGEYIAINRAKFALGKKVGANGIRNTRYLTAKELNLIRNAVLFKLKIKHEEF